MANVPTVTFNNGVEIPQLGFGVWQVPPESVESVVSAALETGYRSIDTAAAYRNEEGVGRAIRSSGLPREEVFVTTKLANPEQGYDSTLAAFEASMSNLGLEYLDLYLIHWPLPAKDLYVETWRAFEKLHNDGRIRAIGVSNFLPEHLDRLAEESSITPAINQIELHPNLPQRQSRAYHAEKGIVTESWSPLAARNNLVDDARVGEIAQQLGKTPAQVILRWNVQLGNVVIPRSMTPERIRSNFELFDFELSSEQMATIDQLEDGRRTGPDPKQMNG